MDFNEFKNGLNENFKKQNINLTEEQCKNFYEYMKALIEWNNKINLTAILEPKEIILKHFYDSITINKYIRDKEKVIDVGTGAGFPGVPLKIINKGIKITLLDSLNKRINFLEEIKNILNLKEIETIHGRAEDYGQDKRYREKFDVCTSRAVAPLNVLLEYMVPFIKKDGICVCMKGQDVEEEINKAQNALKVLGCEIENVETLKLTENENVRNIIIIRKKESTNLKYPRKAGLSKKNPL